MSETLTTALDRRSSGRHPIAWLLLIALTGVTLIPFFVTLHMASTQEDQLLHQRANDINTQVGRTVNSLRTTTRVLGGALQLNDSKEVFDANATPLIKSTGFADVALVDVSQNPPRVIYAAGNILQPGQTLNEEAAKVALSLSAANTFNATGLYGDDPRRVALIQGGPITPAGTVIYAEVVPQTFDPPSNKAIFGEDPKVQVALYASTMPEPSQLLYATTRKVPLTGTTVTEPILVGSTQWTLVVRQVAALDSTVERALPWLILLGGWTIAALVFFVVRLALRGQDEALSRAAEVDQESLAIVDSAQEAFVSINGQGNVWRWSKQATVLLGWPANEVIGKPVVDLLSTPENHHRNTVVLHRLLRTGTSKVLGHRFETEVRNRDGHVIPVEMVVWKGRREGKVAYKALLHDIAERRAAADAQAAAHAAALDASRLKSEFLANMSHEIRTPMNGVIGMTDLLLRTRLDSEQREYAETVRNSGEALLTVINDILDFSKIEAGKLTLDNVDFDVRAVVEGTVELLSDRAEHKGLELAVHIHPDVPSTVNGDPNRIRQVLLNLAANAVKFTDQGEVVVRCHATSEGDAQRLHFEIQDTGIGIDPAHRATLFESFRQVDMSPSRRHEGTGLGLTIARQLTQLMGGDITFKSTLGMGSTFWFDVLVASREPSNLIDAQPMIDIRGTRILVVDDNDTNRRILCQLTSSWDMRPTDVNGGEVAISELTQAVQQGDPFKVVLLDFHMPGEDGVAVARRIRALPQLADLRIVLLTSSSALLDHAALQDFGIMFSLTKPVRQQPLKDRIMSALFDEAQRGSNNEVEPDEQSIPVGTRVLLAEDNPVNQRVATLILKRSGCVVDVASNGAEAVELATTNDYALVFMDCQMPLLDGYEAARKIRDAETADQHVPIIALTASAMKGDRERAMEAGMDDHLPKPVRAAELQVHLRQWARVSNAERNRAQVMGPDGSDVVDATVLASLRAALGKDSEHHVTAVLKQYVSLTNSEMSSLHEAVGRDDFDTAARIAHKLKGSSSTLGVTRVAESCRALQESAESHDKTETLVAAAALAREVDIATSVLGDAKVETK